MRRKNYHKGLTLLLVSMLLCLAVGVKAQTAAQKTVSIDVKSVPAEQVFKEIRKQTGIDFMYSADLAQSWPKVTLRIKQKTAIEAIAELTGLLGCVYEQRGNIVTITLQKVSGRERTIRGTVRDQDGEPLPGVPVCIGETRVCTVTDDDGFYTFKIPTERTVLKFSYVGMETAYITISQGDAAVTRDLTMRSNSLLDDVIVTGYQTISKERATGSFGSITSRQLESKLNADLKNIIEGQVAGLVLDKDGNITIRGLATLNAETDPLIVVDGYPTEGSLSDLNPDNIENITVLKDGVAASIYGSRAANGVIVVTTKSGTQGKTRLIYKGTFKIVTKPDLSYLHQTATSDYIDAQIDIFDQWPTSPYYSQSYKSMTQSEVNYLLTQRRAGELSDADFNSRINQLRQVDGLKEVEKYMFRSALTHTHNVGISGGNDQNRYNLAVNYTNNRSSFINTHDNRLLVDLKNEWTPYKFLKVGVSANLNYSRATSPNTSWSEITGMGSYFQPYYHLKDANGQLTDIRTISYAVEDLYSQFSGLKETSYNPIREAYDSYNNTQNFAARLSGYLHFDIWDGLSAEIGGNWSRGSSVYKSIYTADSYLMRLSYNNSTSVTTPSEHYMPDGDLINETRSTNENWTLRTQLNYSHDFGRHHVSALAGNEVRRITLDQNQYETRMGYNATAGTYTPVNLVGFRNGDFMQDMIYSAYFISMALPIARQVKYGQYGYADNRFVSWYLNGSYEYDNRYLISGSVREDLTNFFGTDPKYRHKPLWSVGGTWKIANERFFNADWVNRLNLRASYGINGNISLAEGPDLILSTYGYDDVTEGQAYMIASYPNRQLRWEKTKTTNLGLDIDVLGNRLGLSFDYYLKRSTDILASDATDPTIGTLSMSKNVGAIDNWGYEVSLHATPVVKKDFRWDLTYNVAFNHSKVKTYNVSRPYATYWAWTEPIHAEGYPMYGLFGYEFAGLNEDGQTLIRKADGSTDLASSATVDDIQYQGTIIPKTDMSLTNSFSYREWSLSFMFIAKLGHKYRKDTFQGVNYVNRHYVDRWKQPGDEATTVYPAFEDGNMDAYYYPFCDINVGNASYAKLRDVTLSYTLAPSLVRRIGMSNARIYLQARNLFRITASDCDIDPEAFETNMTGGMSTASSAGSSLLPLNPEYYIGLTFSF